jgi:hypothetical protein
MQSTNYQWSYKYNYNTKKAGPIVIGDIVYQKLFIALL